MGADKEIVNKIPIGYLIQIECDGKTYAVNPYARDFSCLKRDD